MSEQPLLVAKDANAELFLVSGLIGVSTQPRHPPRQAQQPQATDQRKRGHVLGRIDGLRQTHRG